MKGKFYKCIKDLGGKFKVGDIVKLLQDGTTIYNKTSKAAVYDFSTYLNNKEYFTQFEVEEEYPKIEIADSPTIKSITDSELSLTAESIMDDKISHPNHYTSHPSGIECIEIAKYYDFCIGSAIKYLWRAGLKTEEGKSAKTKEIEDLKKAITFIQFKIDTLTKEK